MFSHKTHRVYAKLHARKTHGVLAFRAEKVKENQGVSAPHQAGVGIYGLPLILTQKSTVNATISEPCTTQDGGFASPYFFSRIKPRLIRGASHRTATPSESKKTRCFKAFQKMYYWRLLWVAGCLLTRIIEIYGQLHLKKQGVARKYTLSALCANTKNQTTKGLQYYEKSKSKIIKRRDVNPSSMGAL